MILSSHWKHQTGIAIKSWFCAVILCRQVLKIMTVLWFKETRSFALPKFGNLHSNTLASLRIGEVLASLANFGNWRSHLFYATCWQIGCSATRAIYKKSYSPSVDESGGYLHAYCPSLFFFTIDQSSLAHIPHSKNSPSLIKVASRQIARLLTFNNVRRLRRPTNQYEDKQDITNLNFITVRRSKKLPYL